MERVWYNIYKIIKHHEQKPNTCMSFIKLHRKKTVISRTEHGKNVNKCFKKKKSMCNSNKMSKARTQNV